MDDHTILQAFRDPAQPSKRDEAFTALVDRYQTRIYRHLQHLVGNADDASDLAQEVFVKVWHKLDGFEGRSQLYTWLHRIATNEALSFLRSRKRRRTVSLDQEATGLPEPEAPMDADGDAMQAALDAAMATLPERQRQVFELRYQDEMPYADMAAQLGLSEGALKASYHHAVKKITAHLRENVFGNAPLNLPGAAAS
jgi:RNA polymerase sigma-70 factor (ECF subfamily)